MHKKAALALTKRHPHPDGGFRKSKEPPRLEMEEMLSIEWGKPVKSRNTNRLQTHTWWLMVVSKLIIYKLGYNYNQPLQVG